MTVSVVHPFTICVACILAVCVCTWISGMKKQVKKFQIAFSICCKKISLKFYDFLLNLETNQRKKKAISKYFPLYS